MKKALTTIGVRCRRAHVCGRRGCGHSARENDGRRDSHVESPRDLLDHRITTIVDGETVDVAKNNDRTGDCDGDSGKIKVTYGYHYGYYNILCAHNTGDRAMMVDYYDSKLCKYVIFRVKDRPTGTASSILDLDHRDRSDELGQPRHGRSGNNATPLISTPMSGDFSITL